MSNYDNIERKVKTKQISDLRTDPGTLNNRILSLLSYFKLHLFWIASY